MGPLTAIFTLLGVNTVVVVLIAFKLGALGDQLDRIEELQRKTP